jgi:hypothetical protein
VVFTPKSNDISDFKTDEVARKSKTVELAAYLQNFLKVRIFFGKLN